MKKGIKALAFDVGGSVFDWKSSVFDGLKPLVEKRGIELDFETFAMEWRKRKFIMLSQVKNGAIPRINVTQILSATLEDLFLEFPEFNLNASEKGELLSVWHRMRAWDGFREALKKMRSQYTVFVLTILSAEIAVNCSKFNDLHWDAIFSCEFLNFYKQEPGSYIQGRIPFGLET